MRIDERAGRRPMGVPIIALCLAALGSALVTPGCRVDENDVHKWEGTAQGPKKLCAVLLHDKYETSLRVDSALALVRMKPRSGRRLAFTQIDSEPEPDNPACKGSVIDVLQTLSPEAQKEIVGPMVTAIITELKKPAPVAEEGKPIPTDESIPYKDAAYGLLTAENPALITDDALKQSLRVALTEWAMAGFDLRVDARGQASSMEQLLKAIGPESVVGLPKKMVRDARKLDAMATLVADIGDAKTKDAAAAALVEIAKWVVGPDWAKVRTKELEAENKAQKRTVNAEQFKQQFDDLQQDELMKLFGSLRRVGGRPAIDFCLEFAANKDRLDKLRQAALAALDGKLDKNKPNPSDLDRLAAIASSDAPDAVVDQAFRRLGELSRDAVADKLFELFKSEKWKIRRLAGATLIKISSVKHIRDFLLALPDEGRPFAMGEALTYGALLGDLKGSKEEGTPIEELRPWFDAGANSARTTAIAYYFTHGTVADMGDLAPVENSYDAAPSCDSDPDCKWTCEVPKEGEQGREQKEIKTIGEFVRHCIQPALKERKPEAGKEQKK